MSNDLMIPNSFRHFFLGFDDLFDRLNRIRPITSFPHYNVVKEEDGYAIELALAGFKKSDVRIEHDKKAGVVRVSGSTTTKSESKRMLAQGISTREFSREFGVADGVEVTGANMEDGILTIKLANPPVRPEEQPLLIEVK